MNIVKASAFSNAAGVVVDTFLHRPVSYLELNLPEWERFQRSLLDVLGGEEPWRSFCATASMDSLCKKYSCHARGNSTTNAPATALCWNDCSGRPGLLYAIALNSRNRSATSRSR